MLWGTIPSQILDVNILGIAPEQSSSPGNINMADLNEVLSDSASESTSFEEFFSGIETSMMQYVKESYKSPESSWDHVQAFISAINWQEKIIVGILCFHAIIFLLFLIFRRNVDFQFGIFIIIAASVYMSERINRWCGENWRDIATQNYFDKAGVFSGIMFSGPLLAIATFQLVRYVCILILL